MTTEPRDTLRRYFAGLSEYTFQTQLGVADPPLIDYLSDMLVRFSRSDTVYRIRSLAGQPLVQVATMLREADQRVGDAKREVHRHIGDFTLFWAGVYPEALRTKSTVAGDHVIEYCTQGKRAYWIASTIESGEELESDVLIRLSQQFEMCAYGLREVRRAWERRDDLGDTPTLLN